jgi:hypothetical protein
MAPSLLPCDSCAYLLGIERVAMTGAGASRLPAGRLHVAPPRLAVKGGVPRDVF